MKLPLYSKLLVGAALIVATPSVQAKPKSWVKLTATPDTNKYVTGTPINIMLTAKNVHSRDAYLHFTSGQRFDLQLFPKGGTEPVYTWSADKMFNMMVGQVRLAPNQSQNFDAKIGGEQGPIAPGKYELRAKLTNSSAIQADPVELEVVAAPVKFEATADKTEAKVGEPITVKMTATNTTDKEQTLNFGSGQSFDLFVSNAEGKSVWSWGANKRFIMALRDVKLAPGESKSFEGTWDGLTFPDFKKEAGSYTIRAVLTTNPRIEAAPITVDVK